MNKPLRDRTVSILIYDGAEVLDFSGPFEVFAVTGQLSPETKLRVNLVAEDKRIYDAVNGFKVVPDYVLSELEKTDVLVIPGGAGSKLAMNHQGLLRDLTRLAEHASTVLSICTGARLLAKMKLLDGLEVVTHHEAYESLAELAPKAKLNREARFVDTGKIITTGGISAGIDGAFHVVERFFGKKVADKTAAYMEYQR
ncbi:DJ-1/PfpI family protein [Pseudidiomarina planktonica]|uniref:DJ-1/PfpI family protein n=1 Tax=Pseudidiomarina planktonica TaxID=1323738 RepID=A0A1Y6E935_9GAMM|nr:DJ-1/PfpI family protein [Pseudidiomarina planktonica]RUO66284.1 DJ-1/PfpI family protein [Pseudidiomarina planktonica]SMQ59125.1 DJ-1/PfpI family protein [Pseudidiomarina planktonica]